MGRIVRKIHRSLVIPLVIFVVAKVISTGTTHEEIITKVTEVTMVLMLITGVIMFMSSKRKKVHKKDHPIGK